MYNYKEMKHLVFKEENQKDFLKVRDNAQKFLSESGSFTMLSAIRGVSGDSWLLLAYVDRLVEIGEIREITTSPNASAQNRVFVRA